MERDLPTVDWSLETKLRITGFSLLVLSSDHLSIHPTAPIRVSQIFDNRARTQLAVEIDSVYLSRRLKFLT